MKITRLSLSAVIAVFYLQLIPQRTLAATCTPRSYPECEQGNPTACLKAVGLHNVALVTVSSDCTYTCKLLGPCTTPTPTSAPQATPTPTPPAGGTTSTPTPTDTPTPASTPVPTGGVTGTGDTTFSMQLTFPGINNTGGNGTPTRPQRNMTLYLYNTANKQTFNQSGTITFDGLNFSNPQFVVPNLASGTYQLYISTDGYLIHKATQNGTDTFTITQGNIVTIPANTLIPGDVAPIPGKFQRDYGDNVLDILDYNGIINCYLDRVNASTCTNKQAPDLDDDGKVDGVDYNLFLRSFSQVQTGDTIPNVSG